MGNKPLKGNRFSEHLKKSRKYPETEKEHLLFANAPIYIYKSAVIPPVILLDSPISKLFFIELRFYRVVIPLDSPFHNLFFQKMWFKHLNNLWTHLR